MDYVNHSGGAAGADMEWETQGRKYGVKTNAYSFGNHSQYSKNQCKLTLVELGEGEIHAKKASYSLKRPWKYIENKEYVKNLISRNWFQVKHSDCVFAIGKFVKNSKNLVDGGTGWAVQMAIDCGKPIYFFEQNENSWYNYDYELNLFVEYNHVPLLTTNFAGIGTREINQFGKEAISEVYKVTFSNEPK